jgi:hypothetical protein
MGISTELCKVFRSFGKGGEKRCIVGNFRFLTVFGRKR